MGIAYQDKYHWTLPHLDSLSIYANQLSGVLFASALCSPPPTITSLSLSLSLSLLTEKQLHNHSTSSLRVLDAFANQFTGTLPSTCPLNSLTYLIVQDNYLSGNIDGLHDWKALLQTNISDNYFDGTLYLHDVNEDEDDDVNIIFWILMKYSLQLFQVICICGHGTSHPFY